ncbi:glycoside hydrolase family 2 protein [Xylanibacillus composti]|uniref:beta-mannosidase n=1 Tax=Xylanibacillus composti TaxID=1572762 RepID=A0A8J4H487_9BACL|nr:sugar-binding domain-containing protein [Xylanibacillus composti]GIQ69296.1 beta-mannosidase [Xylanibacillus composti]
MRQIQLDGKWKGVNERTKEVYALQVPGFVQRDLTEQGVLPDAYDTLFEPKIEWVEHDDWTYSRTFNLQEEWLQAGKLELVFEGIDTYADIFLNGQLIGRTENMFMPYRFDIKQAAARDNELLVRISSPTRVLQEKERAYGEQLHLWNGIPARLFGRKAQYGYGWDWGARLVTVGIHKSVRIEAYEAVRTEQLRYAIASLSAEQAVVMAKLPASVVQEKELEADVVFRLFDGQRVCAEHTERRRLAPGEQLVEAALTVEKPKLWYPAGHGEQPLYRLEAELRAADSERKEACTVGLREIRLTMPYDEQGRKFVIEVNGIPVLCKGVNWIPLKLYPNLDTAEEYRKEIAGIAAANMNMIRIWGGGTYENHAFYEECDRLGMLVWQDFMFACGDYPDDDAFCELVRREARHVVNEYGYHPSIVLWCGNNENQYFIERSRKHRRQGHGEKLYFDVLAKVCEGDTLRPYWPTSPYALQFDRVGQEGDYGDEHFWAVWGRGEPYENYRNSRGRFVSEFGMQSYPSMRVLDQVDAQASLRDPQFDAMQKAPYGLQKLVFYTVGDYWLPTDKASFVYANQLMQANALRYGVEHWLSRMPDTSGALIWQWSDLWPSISWAIEDYAKVLKPSYFYMKRSFQSPNAYAKLDMETKRADLYLIHDSGDFAGTVQAELYDIRQGAVAHTEAWEARGTGHRATHLGEMKLNEWDPSRFVLLLSLHASEGTELIRHTYLLDKPHKLQLQRATLQVRTERQADGTSLVTMSSDVFAKDVGLLNVPGLLSDNYFDLCANETRKLVVYEELPEKLQASCLNQVETTDYL